MGGAVEANRRKIEESKRLFENIDEETKSIYIYPDKSWGELLLMLQEKYKEEINNGQTNIKRAVNPTKET